MEARQVDHLPEGPGWQFEPKWDGFRCIARRNGAKIDLISKSGKPLARYFPEIAEYLKSVSPKRFVIDGELCIPVGSSLSFEALQMRLHPAASRVTKLAKETPAIFILFDILASEDKEMTRAPLTERRATLEKLFAKIKGERLRLSPFTRSHSEAKRWLKRAGAGMLDGVIAKEMDGAYKIGERAMLKIKCLRSADCVVGGFRYATDKKEVGSLLLGLFNDAGELDHVGFTSGIPKAKRAALTVKLERLKGPPGFTGNAPGAPSRWSTERSAAWVPLKHKLVAEVQYDHVTGARFRHGTRFLRWRPDKAPRQCTMEQLTLEARPSKLARTLFGAETE
jgi:ATP-dependent DNA ligase